MAQSWRGLNAVETEAQPAYYTSCNSLDSAARDGMGSRQGNLELGDHSGSQNSFLSFQPVNDDTPLKVTHSFLPLGQQFVERRKSSNMGPNVENVQASPYPAVIRSQPRSQPLNFEELFAGSPHRFETANVVSAEKEQTDESSLVGQNVLYNYVQDMKIACQNHSVMPPGQASQNHNHFGGQNFPNLQGGLVQQTELETARLLQQQLLYQQYMQEMQRQQQNLWLDQHSQWYRQQQLQMFWAAQNRNFASQFANKQDLLKLGAEGWQFPNQTPFQQSQTLSGNVHLPGPSSASTHGEINNHPLGPSKSPQELEALTLESSVINHSSGVRRDFDSMVSENSLHNEQVGSGYHSGGLEEHPVDGSLLIKKGFHEFGAGSNVRPEVLSLKTSPYNQMQIAKPQVYLRYPAGRISPDTAFPCANDGKNMDNYYEEDLRSSGQLADYTVRQPQSWRGVSEQEEEPQMNFCAQSNPRYVLPSARIQNDLVRQENSQQINSAQSGGELLLRNQGTMVSAPQYLDQGRLQGTQMEALNVSSIKQEGSLNLQAMHHQFSINHESKDSAHRALQEQRQNVHYHPGNLHQTECDERQQAVWNGASLQNGSPISGSGLCLFADIDGRQSILQSNSNLGHDPQVLKKAAGEWQLSESRLLEEQGSLQTNNSFPAHPFSTEKSDDGWTAHAFQSENSQMVNNLEAFLEFDEKLDDLTNQQLLEDALGNDESSTGMEWHNRMHSWKQTLQHGFHGISQSHDGELEGRSQIDQVSDRMQVEASPRDMEVENFMTQAGSHVQGHGPHVRSSLEGFVGVMSKEKRQCLQHDISIGSSHDFTQESPAKLWASQNVDNKQEYSRHLWGLQLSRAVDGMPRMGTNNEPMIPAFIERDSKQDFAGRKLDKREKVLNMRDSEPEIPQKDSYLDFTNESKMKLQRSLNSLYASNSVSGSTSPLLSLNSSNVVSDWHPSEVTSTENMNLDQTRYDSRFRQLASQQNGLRSSSQVQTNFDVGSLQSQEKTYLMRTNILPEADLLGNVSFDYGDDISLPTDSLAAGKSQITTFTFASNSMPRDTLQLLNKPEIAEGLLLPIEANQHSKCASQIDEGGHHGLSVSQHPKAFLEREEVRQVHQSFSAENSNHDLTSVVEPTVTSCPSLQPPDATNGTQNPGLLSSTFARVFSSASSDHRFPFFDSSRRVSSHGFMSGRSFAGDHLGLERTASHLSSPLELKLVSSSIATSVASQDLVSQKKMEATPGSLDQRILSNNSTFPKVINHHGNPTSDQQRYSVQHKESVLAISQSLHAPAPRQEARLQLDSSHDTNSWVPAKGASLFSSESIVHSRPRMSIASLVQETLAGDSNRLNKISNDNIVADSLTCTEPIAQSETVENVHLSATHGWARISQTKPNLSAMQFNTKQQGQWASLPGQPPALKIPEQYMKIQAKNLISRMLIRGQNSTDLASSSHLDSMAMQPSSISGSIDGIENNPGILDGQSNVNSSNAPPQISHDLPDSRLLQPKPSTEISLLTASRNPQPGPTSFSGQRLVTSAQPTQNWLSSPAHDPMPSHESSQDRPHAKVYAEVGQPSHYVDKTLSSNSIKKQARMLSNSTISLSGWSADQSAIISKKFESSDHHIGPSISRGPKVYSDKQLNSSIKEAPNFGPLLKNINFEGSSSRPVKIVSNLPLKRKKESSPPLVPWRIAVAQSAELLPTTSGAELQWAAAVNRLPDKDDEGMELHGKKLQFPDHAKQRLRLTTQLMQTIVSPPPAALMQSKSVEGLESATFSIAKVMLGDACSLVATENWRNEKRFREDNYNCCNSAELTSKQVKAFEWGNLHPAGAIKLLHDFKRRVKRLDDCLSRLESFPSASEVRAGVQQVDKLLITNRLLDRHFEDFSVEHMDSLTEANTVSAFSQGTQRVLLRKYVTAVPMPNKLPEGTDLLSL